MATDMAPSQKKQRMNALIERGMMLAQQQQEQQDARESLCCQHGAAGVARLTPNTPPTEATAALVRKQTWTADEDAELLRAVHELGTGDWAAIARRLPRWDRKRVRERFVNHLDPQLRRDAAWTPAEDECLRALHAEGGAKWAAIASRLPGRGPEDVKRRWRELQQSETPGGRPAAQRWTATESAKLEELVDAHGAKDWFFIASHLPPRTDLQCRQHWYRVLRAEKKGRRAWTAAEDALLLKKVQELGHKWTQVCGAWLAADAKQESTDVRADCSLSAGSARQAVPRALRQPR
ncbi:hypothetical protein ATCC90586_009683 [Pythium insidiosum]|nr:hypothetical protein ATCC90586_009683 [Pythium insidiosum]